MGRGKSNGRSPVRLCRRLSEYRRWRHLWTHASAYGERSPQLGAHVVNLRAGCADVFAVVAHVGYRTGSTRICLRGKSLELGATNSSATLEKTRALATVDCFRRYPGSADW